MKDIPKKIYLNINESFKEIESFNDLKGVTWSKERTLVDISYFSLEVLIEAFEAGKDLEAWNNRGGDKKNKPKEFEEWVKTYIEMG